MTKIEMNYMPKSNQSKEIMDRKIEHLKIPLEHDVQHSKNYFNDIKLITIQFQMSILKKLIFQ